MDRVKGWGEWAEALLIAVVLALVVNTFIIQNTRVQGASMIPTLHDGDRMFVNRLAYRWGTPHRGDIVIVHNTSDRDWVKRIVGLPGDRVEIKGGKLYINGEAQEEPYTQEPIAANLLSVEVPMGTVYVMGDNRNHSYDSRAPQVGPIPLRKISGKAKLRYWPIKDITWFK